MFDFQYRGLCRRGWMLPADIKFQRVIGDDAQSSMFPHRESMIHRMFASIPCQSRGMATATPTINKVEEIKGFLVPDSQSGIRRPFPSLGRLASHRRRRQSPNAPEDMVTYIDELESPGWKGWCIHPLAARTVTDIDGIAAKIKAHFEIIAIGDTWTFLGMQTLRERGSPKSRYRWISTPLRGSHVRHLYEDLMSDTETILLNITAHVAGEDNEGLSLPTDLDDVEIDPSKDTTASLNMGMVESELVRLGCDKTADDENRDPQVLYEQVVTEIAQKGSALMGKLIDETLTMNASTYKGGLDKCTDRFLDVRKQLDEAGIERA
ncbi:hypothetical protein PspLS_10648 [Pyricularia sp. CBS 133598]|nr:hypothetical protein PspLS_10648 [Pyricularia sp. CBS 133598]